MKLSLFSLAVIVFLASQLLVLVVMVSHMGIIGLPVVCVVSGLVFCLVISVYQWKKELGTGYEKISLSEKVDIILRVFLTSSSFNLASQNKQQKHSEAIKSFVIIWGRNQGLLGLFLMCLVFLFGIIAVLYSKGGFILIAALVFTVVLFGTVFTIMFSVRQWKEMAGSDYDKMNREERKRIISRVLFTPEDFDTDNEQQFAKIWRRNRNLFSMFIGVFMVLVFLTKLFMRR